ncbi:MAG: hypothetical protein AB1589_39300 [Cyanobacteriota bacterium]
MLHSQEPAKPAKSNISVCFKQAKDNSDSQICLAMASQTPKAHALAEAEQAALTKPMQVITVPTTPTDSSAPPATGGLTPLLMYGGVAVAIIIAMAYYSQTLLKSIADLVKALNKKTK